MSLKFPDSEGYASSDVTRNDFGFISLTVNAFAGFLGNAICIATFVKQAWSKDVESKPYWHQVSIVVSDMVTGIFNVLMYLFGRYWGVGDNNGPEALYHFKSLLDFLSLASPLTHVSSMHSCLILIGCAIDRLQAF